MVPKGCALPNGAAIIPAYRKRYSAAYPLARGASTFKVPAMTFRSTPQ